MSRRTPTVFGTPFPHLLSEERPAPERTLSFADLGYPWDAPGAAIAEALEQSTREWVQERGLLAPEHLEQQFDPVNVGLLTALCFHGASPARLELLSDLLAWIFLKDDELDEAEGDDDVESLSRLMRGFENTLRGQPPPRATPTFLALEELSERLYAECVGGEWFRWFAQSMADFWHRGLVGEARLRQGPGAPSLDAYWRMRVHSIGVLPFLDLVELAQGFALPRAIAAQPEIGELRLLAARIIAYANDVFSYEKERRAHDPNNVVHLLTVHEHLSVTAAVDRTVRAHDQALTRFLALCNEVPSYGTDTDRDVRRYLAGMRSWMRGALDWQVASLRYADGRALLQGEYA